MIEPFQTSKICKFNKPNRTTTNKDLREREYLTEKEVDKICKAARKHSRNPVRDECIILMMFRHGLRASEAVNMKWEQVDLTAGTLHVARLKGSKDSVHPISGVELRLLRKLYKKEDRQRHVFLSERKTPIDATTVYRMVRAMGKHAGLEFPIHPHMLRHGCGYYLANKGVDTRAIQMYMGHTNIQNTVIYTQLSGKSFNGFWND